MAWKHIRRRTVVRAAVSLLKMVIIQSSIGDRSKNSNRTQITFRWIIFYNRANKWPRIVNFEANKWKHFDIIELGSSKRKSSILKTIPLLRCQLTTPLNLVVILIFLLKNTSTICWKILQQFFDCILCQRWAFKNTDSPTDTFCSLPSKCFVRLHFYSKIRTNGRIL